MLGPQDGLGKTQKYVFTVTAVSSIGTTTSHQDGDDECLCKYIGKYYAMIDFFPLLLNLDTSDVQAVNATVVGESTIDIQCWFIHGSDALGCKVVLVSDYPNVSDVYTNLSRSNMSASGQLSLTQNLSCYQRVFAFDIDVNNNTISNLAIEGNITAKAITDCVYILHSKLDHSFSLYTCT